MEYLSFWGNLSIFYSKAAISWMFKLVRGRRLVTIFPILYSLIFYIFYFFRWFHSTIAVLIHVHAVLSLCLIEDCFCMDGSKNSHIMRKWFKKLDILEFYSWIKTEILVRLSRFSDCFSWTNSLASVLDLCYFLWFWYSL